MRLVIEFSLDGVTGPALPVGGLGIEVPGIGVTALDHEALDDAVETSAVVKAPLRERLEILDRLRRDVRPELYDHFARAGLDHRHFLDRGFLVFFPFVLLAIIGTNA